MQVFTLANIFNKTTQKEQTLKSFLLTIEQ